MTRGNRWEKVVLGMMEHAVAKPVDPASTLSFAKLGKTVKLRRQKAGRWHGPWRESKRSGSCIVSKRKRRFWQVGRRLAGGPYHASLIKLPSSCLPSSCLAPRGRASRGCAQWMGRCTRRTARKVAGRHSCPATAIPRPPNAPP